jgi:hypothetical protein
VNAGREDRAGRLPVFATLVIRLLHVLLDAFHGGARVSDPILLGILPMAVRRIQLVLGIILLLACGCGHPAAPPPRADPGAAVLEADPATTQAIRSDLSQIINEATIHYIPLQYDYDEDLLEKLDLLENRITGKDKASTTRLLPKLDEAEERDHLFETVRRWEAATGKKLRASIDPLKADVAARKPGVPYHPEFHKKFAAEFDGLIKIEVLEARERRNRQIHDKADAILQKYHSTHPEIVTYFQKMIDEPPYDRGAGSSQTPALTSPSGVPKP